MSRWWVGQRGEFAPVAARASADENNSCPFAPCPGRLAPSNCRTTTWTEGRDGIEASDGAVMLRPIISGRHAQGSQPFLRGLACAVALSRRGNPEAASSSLSDASTRLGVPRSGGVGLSGPARPHQLDLASKLYVDLVETLDAAPLAPLDSVRALVRMEFLEPVVRFLVPEDDHDVRDGNSSGRTDSKSTSGGGNDLCDLVGGPHYFRLKQRHACLGAIALHGLVVLAGPHPALFTGRTLRYLCYSIQVAYFDLTVGRLAPGVGYPLVFRSIQLACRALAFLATSDVATMKVSRDEHEQEGKSELFGEEQEHMAARYGAPRRVVDCLLSTSAINEVACMAQMPSRGARVGDEGPMYWHLERTVSAAALLIASVCPVPASERDPFTRCVFLFQVRGMIGDREAVTPNNVNSEILVSKTPYVSRQHSLAWRKYFFSGLPAMVLNADNDLDC